MKKLLFLLIAMVFSSISWGQTTYYSKAAATDFNALSSWGTATDGTGTAPASISNADNFVVGNGSVMTLSAPAAVRALYIGSYTGFTPATAAGTLTVASGNTLTVAKAAGYNTTLGIGTSGTLTVTGGTIVLNGNFAMTGGNFNQSGGDINIDGNDNNTAGTSVASGTHLFSISGGTPNCTAGNITIIDPPCNTIAAQTTRTIHISLAIGFTYFTGTHTFIFGDGISTTPGNTDGFVIENYASGVAPINNVTVNAGNGTGRYGSTSFNSSTLWGTFIMGTLTINASSEFRVNPNSTSANLFMVGSIVNNGTFTSSRSSSPPVLNIGGHASATGYVPSNPSSISGTGVFRNLSTSPTAFFKDITINNALGVSFGSGTLALGSYTGHISGTLTMTKGNINTNAQTLILGYATGTLGTLTYTSGGFTSGSTFGRWYAATTAGTTIAASTIPSFGTGSYPFIVGTNSRNFHINRPATTGATGGVIAVQYNDGSGLNTISSVNDGGYSIDRQSAANWVVSTSNGFAAGTGTFQYAVSGQGIYTAYTTNNRLMKASNVVGTNQTGTTLPHVQRIAIAAADFTGTFYLGLSSADIPIQTTQSGKWEDGTTWVGGVAPIGGNLAAINSGHTVTIDGTTGTANCTSLIINSGGTLTASAGTLNVGTSNYNNYLNNSGTLTASGGNFNINGNLFIANGSTFNQSAGTITIDGNNSGSATNSVASGTPLFGIGTSAVSYATGTISLIGGTILIKDPHTATTITNAYAVYGYLSSGVNFNASTAHTLQFGDGSSSDAGGNTSGFYINAFVSSGRLNFGTVVVNNPSGTNRIVTQTGTHAINGDFTVTAGTFDQGTSTTNVGGNISVATAGTILAGGTFIFATTTGTTTVAQTIAQSVSVSGSGAIKNLSTATANFTNITINNTSSSGVTIGSLNNISGNPTGISSVSTNVTFTAGIINTTGSNGLIIGTSAGGTGTSYLTYTSGGFASGSTVGRWWSSSATGTSISASTDPINTNSRFPFVNPSGQARSAWIERVTPTASGITAITYTAASGTTGVSIVDGAYTIDTRTNDSWSISTMSTTPSATSFKLVIVAPTVFGAAPSAANTRVVQTSSVIATHQTGTVTPCGQRISLTLANLTSAAFYLGINSTDIPFVSVASGNWENGSIWNKGTAPTSGDNVTIATGHTITVTTSVGNANNLTINSGATVSVAGSTLTIAGTLTNNGTFNSNGGITTVTGASTNGITNAATTGIFNVNGGTVTLGPAGGSNRTFTNNGSITVSSGTLNINGNFYNTSSTGNIFTQSGGNINVDGNAAGVSANSVSSSTNLVTFSSGTPTTVFLTGGTFTIVDPHASSTSSYALSGGMSTSTNCGLGHTFVFGDGISTDKAMNGFYVYLFPGSSYLQLGNVIVNGSSGMNRALIMFSTYGILGNLTINSGGDFRTSSGSNYIAGNITVNSGGILTNANTLSLASFSNSAVAASTVSQTISSSGFFRNLLPTAAVSVGGSGYIVGDVLTISGGTYTSQATFLVTAVSSGAVSTVLALGNANYSVLPSTPAATSGGSGTGCTLTTLTNFSPTASLASLTINNSNVSGVTLSTPLSISGALTLTAGILNTTATNLLTIANSGTASTGSATSYVNGPMARSFAASRTASGTYSTATVLPLGKGGIYLPLWIDPTTTAGGSVVYSGEAFTSNSGTMGAGVTSLSANRWEALITSGSGNFTSSNIQLGTASITSTNKILQSTASAGSYEAIVPVISYTEGTPNTLKTTGTQILAAAYYGYFAYGDLNPCNAPSDQANTLVTSNMTTTGFTGGFTAASSNPSNYLVVRYTTGVTPSPLVPANYTTYVPGTAFGNGTIVSINTTNTFNATGLSAATSYDFYIYSYNNSACYGPVYNTVSPLMATVTTCATTTGTPGIPTSSLINTTSFKATWTASSTSGVNYILDVATDAGFTSFVSGYNGLDLGLGTLSSTISGLTAATTYYVRVKAVVSGCNSAYSSNLIVTTACNAVTSFNENFDGVTAPSLPACWAKYISPSYSSETVITYATSPNSSPNCVQLYSSGAINATDAPLLITPILSNLSAGTNRLRFYAKGASSNISVIIGTMTDPSNSSTFTAFQTVTGLSTSAWTEYIVNFASYIGSDQYIAFRHPLTTTYSYIYIDNVVWEAIPTPTITSLGSSSGCVGSLLTINGTGLSGATAVTIGGTTATITSNTDVAVTVTIGSGTTGNVAITNIGGTATSVATFTVNQKPTVVVTPTSASYCLTGSQLLTASGDADSYTWSPATGLNATNTASVTATPTVTTMYTVSGVITSTGCLNTATATITVNPNPTAVTVTPATATVVEGNVQSLVAGGGYVEGIGNIGIGNVANTVTTPYKGYWGGNKSQFLYTASELTTMGLTAGSSISAIKFSINAFTGPYTFLNFTIGMKNTASSVLTALETGITTVLAPSNYVLSGTAPFIVSHILTTPFVWDGVSNLLVETCFVNADGGGVSANSANVTSSTTATNMSWYYSNDTETSVCSTPGTGSGSTSRPNVNFVFGITTPITWSPTTELYTDAGATVAYTGTNVSNVYTKPTANRTYTATATTGAGCTSANTSLITFRMGTTTFTANYNEAWENSSNWDNGVPDALINAVIPANKVAVNYNPAQCKNLTIAPTAGLSNIAGAANLTVNGNLLIQSDVTGTGSLISDVGKLTVTGTSTIQRYLSGNVFHQLGIPVSATISAGTAAGQTGDIFLGCFLDKYNEVSNTYTGLTSADAIPTNQGYVVKSPANTTLSFTGILNTGAVNIPITLSGLGYNLVPNPYPSAIDWNAASGWTKNVDANNTIYIWNEASAQFATYDGSSGVSGGNQYIAPGQAFFMKAAATADVIMNNSIRVHNATPYLKSTISNLIKLKVSNAVNAITDETSVYFKSNPVSAGSEKWFSYNTAAPSLYSIKSNTNYSINVLDEANISNIVPLGFVAGVDGNYTIKASELNSFAANTYIYLKDLKSNITQDLKQNANYTFAGLISDNANRFQLIFSLSPLGITNSSVNQTNIYSYDNTVYINSSEVVKQILIYNTLGQLVKSINAQNTTSFSLNGLSTAYYIVKVITDKNVYSEKVLVK